MTVEAVEASEATEAEQVSKGSNLHVILMFSLKKGLWYEISGCISATFLLEAVEASLCYFFENWLMKRKCPNLLKTLGTIIQQNYRSFYPSDRFSFVHFNMIHSVSNFLTAPGNPLTSSTLMHSVPRDACATGSEVLFT